MAGILFVRGDAEHARATFRRDHRGDWSAALPLLLEQHGLLDVEEADPAALQDGAAWDRSDVVLVARLPVAAWTDAALDRVLSSKAPVFVEGPLSRRLRERLGIAAATPADPVVRIALVDEAAKSAAERYGMVPGGILRPAQVRPVDRDPDQDWAATAGVPLTAAQAQAWGACSWDVERWSGVGDGTVLAVATGRGRGAEATPAIARFGNVVVSSFALFAFLGQCRTSEPFGPREHRSSGRTTALDVLLLGILDEMFRAAGVSRARVAPWPHGAEWVLNVRHDFDRPLDARAVRNVLAEHRRLGTSATWYWRSRHLTGAAAQRGVPALREVARDPSHEIALHTERLWNAPDERHALEHAMGAAVAGTSAHGDPHCFRYQGAPNVLWADARGFDYTELIQHAHFHPHRFAALRGDGSIEALRIICLPHHESFDLSMKDGDVNAKRVADLPALWGRPSGFAQVLNHPDVHVERLFSALGELPRGGRLDWTASQASDWWRRTHVRGELLVERAGPAAFRVTSRRGIRGAVLEILDPSGTRRSHIVDLEPGKSATFGATGPAGAPRAPDGTAWPRLAPAPSAGTSDSVVAGARRHWDREVAPVARELIREYYRERGIDPDAAASQTTIRTNTELVPRRAADLLALLATLTRRDGVAGRAVLEAGAGFGALAVYLTLSGHPQRVTAVELRNDFTRLGQRIADAAGLGDLVSFVTADMRDLAALADGGHDVTIANNSLLYLATRRDLRRGLSELFRVTAASGHLLVYQANRLVLRDPFTGSAIPPMLPGSIARRVSRMTSRPLSRDRVMLLTPGGLARELHRAGFEQTRFTSTHRGRLGSGPRHRFTRFISVAGCRRASP